MFKLRQLMHRNRSRCAAARQTGMSLEPMHEEQMHNICELNERNEITWNAGLNL